MTPEIMLGAGAAGLIGGAIAFLMLVTHVRKALKTQPQPLETEQVKDVAELIEQLELLVKHVDVTIQGRLRRLDEALAQADARIIAVRENSAELDLHADKIAQDEGAGCPIWEPPQAVEPAGPMAQTLDQAQEDELVTLPGTWPLPPERIANASATHSSPRPPAKLLSRRSDEIFRLQGEGMTVIDIARSLQIDVGEVQLVLNLKRPQRKQ